MTKILVIDDDSEMQEMLRTVLEKNDFVVAQAPNGLEGIKKVENEAPDLVLTDLIMPEQEGLETIKILRKRFPHIKVIAMSGGGMFHHDPLRMAEILGAAGRLNKPFTVQEALLEIQRVLDKR